MYRKSSELISIVNAGGSLILSASRPTNELINIVNAAKQSGNTVLIKDCFKKRTSELISIANAGEGYVTFEE